MFRLLSGRGGADTDGRLDRVRRIVHEFLSGRNRGAVNSWRAAHAHSQARAMQCSALPMPVLSSQGKLLHETEGRIRDSHGHSYLIGKDTL